MQYIKLIDAFADSLESESIIYHYTSSEGLRGIVESNEIWLTNTKFVNDTTECEALWKIDGLMDRVKNQYLKEMLPRKDEGDNTYIVSFSKDGNSLEQWRAYGNYCIGFEVKNLIKSHFNLYECVYEDKAIKEWILEKSEVEEWEGRDLNDQAKRGAAAALFYHASKKTKNEHYKNEKEIRLIVKSHHTWGAYPNSPGMFKGDPPIYFRDHPIYKIPVSYVKFFIADKGAIKSKQEKGKRETATQMKERKLKEEKNQKRRLLPIKEIIIGPMLHQKEAKVACEILLCEKGYGKVKIITSDIPYRGF